jgi:poly(3-hydroxybutyrate) depolymerase
MVLGRYISSSVAVLSFAHVVGGCSEDPVSQSGSGGANAVGGQSQGGSTGGSVAQGGSMGGTKSSGGAPANGGSSGGTKSSGGATSSGGVVGASGSGGGTAGTGQGGGGGTGVGGVSSKGGSAGLGGSGGDKALGGSGGGAGSISKGGGGGAGGGGSSTSMKSAGCGKAPTLMSGTRTIGNRSFILRIPANYDNTHPYRLVFAYHWRGGTMQDVDGGGTSGAVWSYYGLRAQADDSTIFVAPQGIGNGWGDAGDLKFTDDMNTLIQDDLCVNTKQVFALGFSFGGGMSYALACARPSVFRAVAVYAGAELSGCQGGTEPIAYLGIHGLGDGTLGIEGGRDLRDRFVANNGCTAQNPPEPSPGSQMHTCTSYQGCDPGYPVRWCAFDGGHTPGMVDGGGDDGARTWTKTEAWEFFKQFE